MAFLIEEKDLNEDLFELIKRIHTNEKLLNQIIHNQSQYSDKNVYKYINEDLNKLFNEKKINLGQNQVVHFIGIGGIGMSGLAQVMKNMGFDSRQ